MRSSKLLLALLLPVAALALAGCRSEASVEAPARPAIVARPLPLAQVPTETYAGEVRARHESALAFRLGGKIATRAVDVGAKVSAGEVLAVLEPEDAQLGVAQARAQVEWAKADLALAAAELERHAAMLEKKYISQALYDARRNAHEAAKARLTQSQAALAIAGNQSDYTRLRADHDGVITALHAEAGQVVAAGQPVFTLARDGEREVLINVPESRIAAFEPEMPVMVEIWARDDARVPGRVREISPAADPRTRTYDVRVSLEDPEALAQLGMTARVARAQAGQAQALIVPLSALQARAGEPVVWAVDPRTQRVAPLKVRVGGYREDGATITEGLAPENWIVVLGAHKLVEGQKVRAVDAANKPVAFEG